MTQLYHYILESWKIITKNFTITDEVTDKTSLSVYYIELENNYYKYHCYY
jgi:hypothetical protein